MKINDEWVTPIEAVKPLVKEFKGLKEEIILDPFGSPTSAFNAFKEVLNAEVFIGDFFMKEEDEFLRKVIVSNPPNSCKTQVLTRCLDLYEKKYIKGFALLMPLPVLQGVTRGPIFKHIENLVRIRIFNQRIKYLESEGKTQTRSCVFGSIWICYGPMFMKGVNISWY